MLQRLCAATMRRTVAGRSRVALNAIALQDGIVYDYAYDGAERLKDVTVTGAGPASETFTYDLAGNRTTWSGAPGAAASYDLDDEIEGAGEAPYAAYEGDTVYVHDANGNVTAKTTQSEAWEYGYDVKNRLVEVKLDGATVAAYGYDPFNRRLWKETGGQRTWYLYSKEGLIGEYLADSGTPPVELKSYGYLPGSSWTTNPLFQKVGEEYFWYLNDHLGTPRMMVDTNGETVWSADYEAYGKATVATGTIANNIRFPGQYYDAESGLHWNFNRYYDPGTGRYVGVDPIRHGVNWYWYVNGNPISNFDNKGTDTLSVSLAGTIGAGIQSTGGWSANLDDRGNISVTRNLGLGVTTNGSATLSAGVQYTNAKNVKSLPGVSHYTGVAVTSGLAGATVEYVEDKGNYSGGSISATFGPSKPADLHYNVVNSEMVYYVDADAAQEFLNNASKSIAYYIDSSGVMIFLNDLSRRAANACTFK